MDNRENKVANWLHWVGVAIIFIGVICGFAFGNVERTSIETPSEVDEYLGLEPEPTTETDYSWTIAMTYWIGGLVSGLFFIGIAEIIYQLVSVNDRLYRLETEMKRRENKAR